MGRAYYIPGKLVPLLYIGLMVFGCAPPANFEFPEQACATLVANASFEQLKTLYSGETMQIQEDWIIEGYVVSSDKEGNFFNVLHLQDNLVAPTGGIELNIDLRDSFLFFGKGQKVFLQLQGLYLGKTGNTFKIGGTFTAFGTTSVGRLPALKIDSHIFNSCDESVNLVPTLVQIQDLDSTHLNTIVRLDNMQVVSSDLDLTFALPQEETLRTLEDCLGNQIELINSGFSNFQEELLPEGNGTVTAIVLEDGGELQLAIREVIDLNFSNQRCAEIQTEFTSTAIYISELADPENDSGARFIEIFNSAEIPLSLKGWQLRRYTNANTEVSSSIDLSGWVIQGGSTLVISPNAEHFEQVYGFAPDVNASTGSPADSNGDDNLELVDPFNTVIDRFGIIGEDGSGTNHEFEDGRALRNSNIHTGNPNYTAQEWTLYNDTGSQGTINQPQNAPDNYTPGVHN